MKVTLTDDQTLAFEQLKEFADSTRNHLCLLEGCAGVGKTFLVSNYIQWLIDQNKVHSVTMCATTNKAVKVLRSMCPDSCKTAVGFSTLHSLLGLRHEIDKNGKEIFVRDKKVMAKFPFCDFVIVDEASMVADQLFNELQEQNFNHIKVLFVGDSNQINPVNHSMAIPMREEMREQFNISHIKLNKIVRQAEGNPIIGVSQKIIKDEFEYQPGYKNVEGDSGVVMIDCNNASLLAKLIKFYFGTTKFDDNPDFCKIIAWRNKTVDYYNAFVRAFKYGKNAPKIVVGEKLIVDRPIAADSAKKEYLFTTNEELVVNNVTIGTKKLFTGQSWKYYECDVHSEESHGIIHILHEDEHRRYDEELKSLSKDAAETSDIGERVKKWKKYYSFMENFAQVNYNYAITGHCSQGSTYENAFVIYSDISLNRRSDEMNRILYTSVTRPKKMLFLA